MEEGGREGERKIWNTFSSQKREERGRGGEIEDFLKKLNKQKSASRGNRGRDRGKVAKTVLLILHVGAEAVEQRYS